MKALTKANETPEERRKRRLEKKEKKHRKEGGEILGYSNDSNPFGDPNLLNPFVWHKKNEIVARELGKSTEEVAREHNKSRRHEIISELEKAKRRREERIAEQQRWEAEKARMAREAEGMASYDWERKEEEFHLQQAKIRSEIRLRENRAKPIDILAKNLELSDEFDLEINEPYKIFTGLQLSELEDVKKDIQIRLELGQAPEFWGALLVVCDDHITTQKALVNEKAADGRQRFGVSGIHRVIENEVIRDLDSRSFQETCELHSRISRKLNEPGVDSEYWEAVLKRVAVQKAKAKLREIHADLLRKRLTALQSRQREQLSKLKEEEIIQDVERAEAALARSDAVAALQSHPHSELDVQLGDRPEYTMDQDECFSPVRMENLPEGEEAISESADEAEYETMRQMVLKKTQTSAEESTQRVVALIKAEKEKGMEDGESAFNIEHPIADSGVQWWHDKYRPRRPRYFNRVHTGFEWTKYNQTHYDHDNPPPKTVQGYKFNIFYPDLIDPTDTPKYFLEPGDNPDTQIIRFHAGPPYEDIAFKIVKKEWEVSRRTGFKCTFERGVLHLYFNFTRLRYRR
eukprot:c9597_g1_i1.p1 GENE.c9597_g1_i1~~c9597_g1_i1.p1  ORF type:complete len:610 (-),score=174.12 c9597_g1_i1:31-1755(-)